VNELLVNLAVVFLFTLIGGFFAASEIALVSLRDSQVGRLAETAGRRGRRVRQLIDDPNRFLAAVQVGVTLAGFLSAGFGASQIAPQVAPALESLGLPASAAGTVAFVGVTVLIAYLSLVFGELVPKRLALQRAESVALAVTGPVDLLARLSRPFIWLLSVSTDTVVRLLGLDPDASREGISGEELRGLVAAQESLGSVERELIDDVLTAGGRDLAEVMVPRTEVDFLDVRMPMRQAADRVRELPHSRYPVVDGSADEVVGFVHVRDLLDPSNAPSTRSLRGLLRPVLRLPDSKQILAAMQEMRDRGSHLAIVADEYGGTAGIVTMEDLMEELIGDIRDEFDVGEVRVSEEGGPVEVDGLMSLADFAEHTDVPLPHGPYETVAGFMVNQLGRMPRVGDAVEVDGSFLGVAGLDGRRISRVVVSRTRAPADEPTE
jgi:putative hemolysin